VKHTTPGYSGGETLAGAEVDVVDASILNFWQWAYSDLLDNVNRGTFAEWMVAKLLGVPLTEPQSTWQPWDISTPEGVRIEVKTSAYVHQWTSGKGEKGEEPVAEPAKIVFGPLCSKVWLDEAQTKLADELTYNADLYVFCLQKNPDPKTWDGLDLRQWEFYLLRKAAVEEHGTKTVALGTVSDLGGGPLTAAEFQHKVQNKIAELAGTPEVKARLKKKGMT